VIKVSDHWGKTIINFYYQSGTKNILWIEKEKQSIRKHRPVYPQTQKILFHVDNSGPEMEKP